MGSDRKNERSFTVSKRDVESGGWCVCGVCVSSRGAPPVGAGTPIPFAYRNHYCMGVPAPVASRSANSIESMK